MTRMLSPCSMIADDFMVLVMVSWLKSIINKLCGFVSFLGVAGLKASH